MKKDIFYIACIGVLAIALVYTYTGEPKINKVKDYVYKTDTIYSNQKFEEVIKRLDKLEKVQLEKTPPKEIIYYPNNPDSLDKVIIEKIPDSLVVYISQLEKSLAIADNYIKNYPSADKLIDFQLSFDNLDISTVDIQGNKKKQDFPLYLDRYNYIWSENELNKYTRKSKITLNNNDTWKKLYFYTGYDYIHSSPKFEMDYQVDFGRFRIKVDSDLLIQTNPELNGSIGLGYRLIK